MPLDWLGQLSPTMQQQIALQRALLALQREDEQIRATTPALARGLEGRGGAAPTPYAGPTPRGAGEREPAFKGGMEYSPITTSFRPGAGSLEEALRAAEPATGKGLDIQGRAWAKREEMVEGRVVGAKEAYDRIVTLDPAGQKVALTALRKYKREVYNAMETEGYLSPAGELVKPKEAATSVQYVTSDAGEMIALTTYPDGRIETEHTGVYPAVEKEGVAAPTITEAIALEELGMKQTEFAERHRADIIKVLGDMPRIGLDTVTEGGKEIPAEAKHVTAWLEGYSLLNALFAARAGETLPEGEATMGEAQAEFEGSTGEVKMTIQQKLGVPQTGEWDEDTEFALSTYGDILLGEKPAKEKEGEPLAERRKRAWSKWWKLWGKVLKTKGVNIFGETEEEWKEKKGVK